ncbi:MAG: hypothetical protein LQ341_003492 [Variospora aurantia]|nr:MAG: hypothetical protein LQ341_003492 [Variospora aurantia]
MNTTCSPVMAYTHLIMAPIMNYLTGLESIGSVAANFARTEAGEKTWLLYESPESAYVLQMHGQAAHDDYLAWKKTSSEQRTLDDKKRRERRRRQLERCRHIRKLFKKVMRSLDCFSE